jgi:hypothetical protein
MFVYLSRKHRRALHDLMQQQWPGHDLPRGSRATVRAALGYLGRAIEVAYCNCDDCKCGDADFREPELMLADDFVAALLGPKRQRAHLGT